MAEENDSEVGATADRWRAALQSVNRQLDDSPLDVGLWVYKAHYYEKAVEDTVPKRTRIERTLLWHRHALRLEPNNWVHWFHCARALYSINRYNLAKDYAERAADLAGSNCRFESLGKSKNIQSSVLK